MHQFNSARRLRPEELQVDRGEHPDWASANDHPLNKGDRVWCAAGEAEVVKMLGKTSEGTRILELKLLDGTKAPFFASAANVLVAPPATAS